MVVYVCVGNGIRADGSLSRPSQAVVDTVFTEAIRCFELEGSCRRIISRPIVIFSGGYRSPGGVAEAEAMMRYAYRRYGLGDLIRYKALMETGSYRTHNNAIESLSIIASANFVNATIAVADHPLHLPRTLLAFEAVNRSCHRRFGLRFVGLPSEEVYDVDVFNQPQWRDRQSFVAHERIRMLLYRVFFFPPWARLGLKALVKAWPNRK